VSSLALTADVDVGAVLLETAGTKLGGSGVHVEERITDGRLERTMEGASTLTLSVDDSDRTLLRSGVFSQQLDLYLAGEWWRLVQVSKQGDMLSLTFEDRAVAYLRKITTPRKAKRSKMTRAQFALSIVREVKAGGGIGFVCPDLTTKQPIATSSQKLTTAKRQATSAQGLSPGAALTVKGSAASSSQRATGQRVLDAAASVNAGDRATMALVQACIVESTMQNLNYGDRDSLGVLQVRSSTASGMGIDNRDVEACCNAFLVRGFYADPVMGAGGAIEKAAKFPSATTGRVAQAVQGSAVPTAYDQWKTEAAKWVAAYGGAAGTGSGSFSTTTTVPYQFQRGGTDGTVEDSWTCLQRLATEVGWRCYIAGGAVHFVSEPALMKQGPRVTLSEDTLGVDNIDFDIDNGKTSNEATVSARVLLAAFPAGSVVELADCGPADGRWLVRTVERGVFDAAATVTLKRVTQPLPEPAADTTTSSTSAGSTVGTASFGSSDGTESPLVDKAYAAAQAIDAKRYPYVWGGGHARAGYPDHGQSGHSDSAGTIAVAGVGYDCSGSTCAMLAAAGMGYTLGGAVDDSGTIAARWGEPGEGQYMTVWANSRHVWTEFRPPGQPPTNFNTSDYGKGWEGPGFNPRMPSTAGFTPRHWPES
jgi:hypothetical protein